MNNRDESRYKKWESDHEERGTSDLIPAATVVITVSYTHLTLPTIYSV